MTRLSPLLVLLLCGCAKPLALLAPAEVPDDIKKCLELKLSAIPARDLNEAEVEKPWKWDRYVAVARGQCLNRLVLRDQTLAGKR